MLLRGGHALWRSQVVVQQTGAAALAQRGSANSSSKQYATAMQSAELARGMFTPGAASSSSSISAQQQRHQHTLQRFFTQARNAVRGRQLDEGPVVQEIVDLMGAISLEELGLDPDAVSDPYAGALKLNLRDRIKYMRIYEDHLMTLGLFCFPAGTTIPLHNHPGMTVFSRLMFGSLRVTAYDWLEPHIAPVTSGSARAKLIMDTTVDAPAPPLVLFPASGGNLHEFAAQTPCVLLDLLTPPYEPPARDCTYYRVQQAPLEWPVPTGAGARQPAPSANPEAEVELEVYNPHDFEVVSGLYPGLAVK